MFFKDLSFTDMFVFVERIPYFYDIVLFIFYLFGFLFQVLFGRFCFFF